MTPLLILSILTAWLFGLLLLTCLWPNRQVTSDLALKLPLSIGLGLGATSCLLFVWLLILGGGSRYLCIFELAALLACGAIIRIRSGKGSATASRLLRYDTDLTTAMRRFFVASFCVLLASKIAVMVVVASGAPHGDWDAWAIWNLRARFIFRGGEHWVDAFDPELRFHHPDYPLLLPATVARCWLYTGSDDPFTPLLVAILFTAGSALLLFTALAHMRNAMRGFFAAFLLLATPAFLRLGAMQYADVPLGFFFLSTFVLLLLPADPGSKTTRFLLAGTMTGLAAWTKNEGLLFLVSLIAAHAAVTIFTQGIKPYMRELRSLGTGLAPMLLVLAYMKGMLAPSNDLFREPGAQPLMARLSSLSRLWYVTVEFGKRLFAFGDWRLLSLTELNPFPLMAGYGLLAGFGLDRTPRTALLVSIGTIGLTLAGYFLVFLVTPKPLEWHMQTSCSRLILQLWPSVIFVYSVAVK